MVFIVTLISLSELRLIYNKLLPFKLLAFFSSSLFDQLPLRLIARRKQSVLQ